MSIGRLCTVAFVLLFYSTSNAQLTYNELRVEYDSPWTYKNLQLIPVKFKEKKGNGGTAALPAVVSLSFSEALQKRKISVQEMQYKNGADINWLQVTNNSKQNVVRFYLGSSLFDKKAMKPFYVVGTSY